MSFQFSVFSFQFSVLTSLRAAPFSFQFSVFVLSFLIFIQSCGKHPEIPITISRLEKSLFAIPVDSIEAHVSKLQQQYGTLLDKMSLELGIQMPDHDEYAEDLARFITYPDMVVTFQKVMAVFPDLRDIESGFGRAFFNYEKEFPDRTIPELYTLISGFNSKWIVTDEYMAIALDHYLGSDEDIYGMLMLPNYERRLRDKKYIVPQSVNAWLTTEFPFNDSINTVLNNILYHGKLMYAMHQLLPCTPDSILFGFTPAQMRWCGNNSTQMWTHLVENRLLFASDQFTINKFVGPAPFTSTFTRESPGRAAVWLGYKIVASYMKREKVSLQELMLTEDYQQILQKAKFRP